MPVRLTYKHIQVNARYIHEKMQVNACATTHGQTHMFTTYTYTHSSTKVISVIYICHTMYCTPSLCERAITLERCRERGKIKTFKTPHSLARVQIHTSPHTHTPVWNYTNIARYVATASVAGKVSRRARIIVAK